MKSLTCGLSSLFLYESPRAWWRNACDTIKPLTHSQLPRIQGSRGHDGRLRDMKITGGLPEVRSQTCLDKTTNRKEPSTVGGLVYDNAEFAVVDEDSK